ncbi:MULTISPECIES: 2TM domain-containing protein [unclassified Symbiopectobacterium]|uniref:2TM domain-containing protein n=1 Tax=unclassified Symbiopectobacterium TaxID=2794573 RepID=UPI0022264B10|nr:MULTISPECIES: 2TM domain-containing protein [unclassified Symbiopectobacterium]MCW2476372.1 2TM domain-containing protein [Candidatus Symbiopectobacterium sp. NZEC151]MCW2487738.1 2TM domain-containing protein [Candidatus Symbiopectobacterium sp. NZEC127]
MNTNPIKTLRLARAWSQEQLAELSSLSVRTVQRIENGERASLDTLGAIAAAFGVNVTELMTEESEQTLSGESLELRVQAAKRQVRQESRFWRSLVVYVVVNLVLFVVNRMTSPGSHWFLWPLLIWGGFLALNAVKVFWLRDRWQRWEQARVQRVLRKP